MNGLVAGVHRSPRHGFSKQPEMSIRLLTGLGVEGDAHCGATVQHVYLKRRSPFAPNRMQVHLLQEELLQDLAAEGLTVLPGELGENITTSGVDLLNLPLGTRLTLGATAVVELTGLRTPCKQIEAFRGGLQKRMSVTRADGTLAARVGVMAVVLADGVVQPADTVHVELPPVPHRRMEMI